MNIDDMLSTLADVSLTPTQMRERGLVDWSDNRPIFHYEDSPSHAEQQESKKLNEEARK